MNTTRITLLDGKPHDIYFDFNSDEFNTQFNEIFGEQQYKSALRKKDMTILDIGGNIGLSVLYFKDWAKEIYVVEPNKIYYDFLVHNIYPFKHIKPFNIGLGLGNGKATLFANEGEQRTESMFSSGEANQAIDLMTIDKFIEDNNIEHIDVLKIDCEGSEYPILMSEGFGKIASKVDYIIGEAHHFGRMMPEYIPEILKDYGFTVKWLPFKNIYNTLQFNDGKGNPLTKIYKIWHHTIFEAYRE